MADSEVGAGNLQDDRGASQSPESEEVFKTQNHNHESCGSQPKELPWAKARTTGAGNRVNVVYYNTKYETHTLFECLCTNPLFL